MEYTSLVRLILWGLETLCSFWVAPWDFVLDPVLVLPATSLGAHWVPLGVLCLFLWVLHPLCIL